MSFQQGLSGLNVMSKNLDVIGNNIANASTVGAKSSRAEFADHARGDPRRLLQQGLEVFERAVGARREDLQLVADLAAVAQPDMHDGVARRSSDPRHREFCHQCP